MFVTVYQVRNHKQELILTHGDVIINRTLVVSTKSLTSFLLFAGFLRRLSAEVVFVLFFDKFLLTHV